jgi:hypothetical protein
VTERIWCWSTVRDTRPWRCPTAIATRTRGSRPTARALRSTFAPPTPRRRMGLRARADGWHRITSAAAATLAQSGHRRARAHLQQRESLLRLAPPRGGCEPSAEVLHKSGYDHYTGAVSRDGKLLAFAIAAPSGCELWTVRCRDRRRTSATSPTISISDTRVVAGRPLDGVRLRRIGQGVSVFVQSFPTRV